MRKHPHILCCIFLLHCISLPIHHHHQRLHDNHVRSNSETHILQGGGVVAKDQWDVGLLNRSPKQMRSGFSWICVLDWSSLLNLGFFKQFRFLTTWVTRMIKMKNVRLLHRRLLLLRCIKSMSSVNNERAEVRERGSVRSEKTFKNLKGLKWNFKKIQKWWWMVHHLEGLCCLCTLD